MKSRIIVTIGAVLFLFCFLLTGYALAETGVTKEIDKKTEMEKASVDVDVTEPKGFQNLSVLTCEEMYSELYLVLTSKGNEDLVVAFPKETFEETFYAELEQILNREKLVKMEFYLENGKEFVKFHLK